MFCWPVAGPWLGLSLQLALTLTLFPCAQLRFELAQAADALQFASDPGAPAVRRQAEFVETAWAALAQEPGEPVPLGEQVISTPCCLCAG